MHTRVKARKTQNKNAVKNIQITATLTIALGHSSPALRCSVVVSFMCAKLRTQPCFANRRQSRRNPTNHPVRPAHNPPPFCFRAYGARAFLFFDAARSRIRPSKARWPRKTRCTSGATAQRRMVRWCLAESDTRWTTITISSPR